MNRIVFGCFLLCLILAGGCSRSSDSASSNGSTDPRAQSKTNDQSSAQQDLDEPLSNYTDVTGDPKWISKWALANVTEKTYSDEDIMNSMEDGYQQEQNAFKKHQMMETDLPKIKDEIAKFKGKLFLKYSDVDQSFQMGDAPYLFSGYDLTTHTFKATTPFCLGGQEISTFMPQRNIEWKPSANTNLCLFKVDDQNIAKTMEEARLKSTGQGGLSFTGITYVKVVKYEFRDILLQATHVHYDVGLWKTYQHKDGATPLGTFDE